MKKNFLMLLSTLSAIIVTPLVAGEMTVSVSAEIPEGIPLAAAQTITEGNNIWKRTSDSTPGERRDVGQRFSITEAGRKLDKIALHVAVIPGAVGSAAAGAPFTLTLVRFASPSAVSPDEAPLFSASGHLPSELQPGQYLVLDIPDLELETREQYGFQLSFESPGPGRSLNLSSASKADYPQGRCYFYTNPLNPQEMEYQIKGANFVFYIIGQ